LQGFPERGTAAILVYTYQILVDFQITPISNLWTSIKELNAKERARIAAAVRARGPSEPSLFSSTTPFTNLTACIAHAQKERKAILLVTGHRGSRFPSLWDWYCHTVASLSGLPAEFPEKYLFCVLEMKDAILDKNGNPNPPGVRELQQLSRTVLDRYFIRIDPQVTLLDCNGDRISSFIPFEGGHVAVLSFLAARPTN
jgi:hypothetical protein